MKPRIISVTTDFGVQSQGLGIMEAVAYSIAPNVKYINLMHGLPSYSIAPAARALETSLYLPVGCHVCIVDPGVGSSRRGIIISTKRGDYMIGPDNGVLLPATRILGGIIACNVLENPKYMLIPVSPLFHGRDVFMPAAAHLAKGVPPDDFGSRVPIDSLEPAPYEEAFHEHGNLEATVIHINQYGSAILNISHSIWDSLALPLRQIVRLMRPGKITIEAIHGRTFSDVPEGHCVIMRDDYSRVEIAINLGNFSKTYGISTGDCLLVSFKKFSEV